MASILPRELTGHTAGQSLPQNAQRRQRFGGILLVLVAALIYMATLDTGLQPYELLGGDLITHQYAQVQARPSNAPGYPLYTMGGWLWFHGIRGLAQLSARSPISPIPILSSYSSLWALLAIWLLYAIVCRLTRSPNNPAGNWPLGWLLAAFYAVTYFFWYYATTTEQYSSAIAQMLAILYVYLVWRDRATQSLAVNAHATRILFLLAFLCGLSLAHMLTIAFIVPPLVLVILWQRPDLLRSPRAIFGSVIAAALPLLGYIFVYVRGAAHPEWWGEGDWPNAGAWFVSFLSTAQGREELGWGFEPGAAFFGNGFPELVWQELSMPLLVFGLLGILLYDRKLAALLYGTIALTIAFSWAYRFGNWYQVILPAYPLILLGNAAIADTWMRYWGSPERRMGRINGTAAGAVLWALPLILLATATLWRTAASLPAANSRNRPEDQALARAAILLDQDLPPEAPLFAAVDDALALQYLIDIWGVGALTGGGRHPVISSREAAEHLSQGDSLLATQGATGILLDEIPADLPVQTAIFSADWVSVGPYGEYNEAFKPKISLTPIPGEPDGITVADSVTLVAFAVSPSPLGKPLLADQPSSVDLALVWQLDGQGWPEDLAISIRPTAAGAFLPDPMAKPGTIIQVDSSQPIAGRYDSNALRAGSTILDAYRLPFPHDADGILLILYRATADGFKNLAEIPLAVQ